MRVIGIEEHFAPKEFDETRGKTRSQGLVADQLDDVGEARLADMDRSGIDVQVLSSTPPNPPNANEARKWNDRLAEIVATHPDRYAGFATLATPEPESCAAELERGVSELGLKGAIIHGHANGRFLDHKDYWPIFEAAEALDVPIYLHPTPPTKAIYDAYYSGLDSDVADVLSTSAWGWHAETGLHSLRLIVSGLFDRFPRLQIVIGHMGENVPFSLARANSTLARVTSNLLERSVAEYFTENFYITTSAYFTHPPLLCALLVVGADRIIFSVDYPFSQNAPGRAFLDSAPISVADREKIAHGNVEHLLHL